MHLDWAVTQPKTEIKAASTKSPESARFLNRIVPLAVMEHGFLSRWSKFWVVATLCSGLIYDIYWLRGTAQRFFKAISLPPQEILVQFPNFFTYTLPIWIGETLRFIGFSLALIAAYLAWGPKHKQISQIAKYVSVALLFEGIYFLCLLPTNIVRIVNERDPLLLYLAFVLQILLVTPSLAILSFKVWNYREERKTNVLKWAATAGMAYLIGIWINNVFRWFSMMGSEGITFILSGATSLGFLNAILSLSASILFAAGGVYFLFKKTNHTKSTRLFAISLICVGLYFLIFIAYSIITNSVKWIPLVEIWPVTLLGLGLSLLRRQKDQRLQ